MITTHSRCKDCQEFTQVDVDACEDKFICQYCQHEQGPLVVWVAGVNPYSLVQAPERKFFYVDVGT